MVKNLFNNIPVISIIFLFFIIKYALAQSTNSFLQISLLVAFLGGVIAILSPCSLAIIPAFFAYALEGKKELMKMTFFFFLGLSIVLVPLGFAASLFGQFLTSYRVQLTLFAGIMMIIFGVFAFFDISIPFLGSLFTRSPKTKNKYFNTFLFGILFATGFSPCAGPVLGAILTLAVATRTALTGAIFLLVYAFGMVTPLFLLSYFFEKIQFHKSRLVIASFEINILGFRRRLHWTKVASGIIFIAFGIIFIVFRGTSFLLNLGAKLNLLEPFFVAQDFILKYFNSVPNHIGILLLLVAVAFVIGVLYRKG